MHNIVCIFIYEQTLFHSQLLTCSIFVSSDPLNLRQAYDYWQDQPGLETRIQNFKVQDSKYVKFTEILCQYHRNLELGNDYF